MSIITSNQSTDFSKPVCAAKDLTPSDRQNIAARAVAQESTISGLADENGTSRKFIYEQKAIASAALEEAFERKEKESEVLFYLPVTKSWLRQFIISLILVCRCSYRGAAELLRDQFDHHISVGSVHNIVQDTVEKVKVLHEDEDLSGIKVGAPDEIFQGGKPVLAACDVESLYCYLLKPADHRDGDTWAIHLMECQDKGLNLDYSIADLGKGLRAGQDEAMPGTPCLVDHFHVLYDMGKARTYLKNRANRAMKSLDDLEKKMERAKKKSKGNKLSKNLASARTESTVAIKMADDFGVLTDWMQEILAPVGPDHRTRTEMFNFIVDELRSMEFGSAKHRITPVRCILENNKELILRFALLIDEKWKELSDELDVDDYLIRKMYESQSMPIESTQRYKLELLLRKRLRGKFYLVYEAVSEIQVLVHRASSATENYNSRLRNYFFLRKILGPNYLELLRFFLNERRFLASDDPRRAGKSPAEIKKGLERPHWLEQLGYTLFKRAA